MSPAKLGSWRSRPDGVHNTRAAVALATHEARARDLPGVPCFSQRLDRLVGNGEQRGLFRCQGWNPGARVNRDEVPRAAWLAPSRCGACMSTGHAKSGW